MKFETVDMYDIDVISVMIFDSSVEDMVKDISHVLHRLNTYIYIACYCIIMLSHYLRDEILGVNKWQ